MDLKVQKIQHNDYLFPENNWTLVEKKCEKYTAFGHHGEFIQGVFSNNKNEKSYALISMPCSYYKTEAILTEYESLKKFKLKPNILKLLNYFKMNFEIENNFSLEIISEIPIGKGLGSSTADLVAAINVINLHFQLNLNAFDIIKICVEIEKASDPLLVSTPCLFAQQIGEVIKYYDMADIKLNIVGIQSKSFCKVETKNYLIRNYEKEDLKIFSEIESKIDAGFRTGDSKLIAEACVSSAQLNQKFIQLKDLEVINSVAQNHKALGYQISHSGTCIGIIYDAKLSERSNIDSLKKELNAMGYSPIEFSYSS